MIGRKTAPPVAEIAEDGRVAAMTNPVPFTLAPGHPMRGGLCIMCRTLLGGEQIGVVGIAILAGQACSCGSVPAQMFLAHAFHRPFDAGRLLAQVQCQAGRPHDHGKGWE